MNSRQRRGIVLIILGAVVAALVFVVVTIYVRNVSSQVGPMTTVYAARDVIDPYTPLGPDNLQPVELPQRWSAPSARVDLASLEGRRVGFQLEAGTVVTSDMLIPPSDLNPSEREIAINVDAVTGVAGRVRPGDRVDVFAIFSDVPGLPRQAQVLVRDVRVVSVGGTQTVVEEDEADGLTRQQSIPVTLALEPDDSLAVTYASAFAEEVRLVALPTDRGVDRGGEIDQFDAGSLGGQAVPEGQDPFNPPEVVEP
ncbi:MAG: Flp pilus assembly protein CpaB [Kineosporiaceae bacterium]